jgi:signal transduction histidine kinase
MNKSWSNSMRAGYPKGFQWAIYCVFGERGTPEVAFLELQRLGPCQEAVPDRTPPVSGAGSAGRHGKAAPKARGGGEGEVADKKPFPLWLANLLAFGLFFAASAGYHLWQMAEARGLMKTHALAHAYMVASVIRRNAEAAVLTRDATEEVLKGLLGNTARFVSYLDRVDPFSGDELSAFSKEAGLRGISIVRSSVASVEGPASWLKGVRKECPDEPSLEHIGTEHLYLLRWPSEQDDLCVIIGSEARRLEELLERMSLSEMSRVLSNMPGITFVRVGNEDSLYLDDGGMKIISDKSTGKEVVEVRLPVASSVLSVGVDTDFLTLFNRRIWRGFFIFSTSLALFGGVLSLLLYRGQKRALLGARRVERELSRSREEAALGRAAASISHEIRNSLNVVAMGLQRFEAESPVLCPDSRRLVQIMSDAVARANETVTGLLRYARPPSPSIEAVFLDAISKERADVYKERAEASGISFSLNLALKEPVAGDPILLRQVLDNLIKNPIEAQSRGGYVVVSTELNDEKGFFSIRNPGFKLPREALDRIFDPYFTTKADGTGLGLSIANRIIKAHGGRMNARLLEGEQLEVSFFVPLWKGVSEPPGAGKEK